MKKVYYAIISLILVLVLTGCTNTGNNVTSDHGTLTLSINPEIAINYNQDGEVLGVAGINTDGKSIVANYQDYIGKDVNTVVNELIVDINEAGYFLEDIDGNKRNIVIKIEPNSVLPSETFTSDLNTSISNTLSSLNLASKTILVDDDDYDHRYDKEDAPSRYITLAKAEEIAKSQAGVSDVVFDEKEFDFDDNVAVYELTFRSSEEVFDYDIDALSGKVLKAQRVPLANSGDDTDYGPDNDGVTDYHLSDYGFESDGVTDYGNTDYGLNSDGYTDYDDTDYGPNNDGVTDYDDTDYGPNSDGVTDYDDTDYGPNNDGVTDHTPAPAPTPAPTPAPSTGNNSDYDNNSDYGNSNYNDSGYSDYDD